MAVRKAWNSKRRAWRKLHIGIDADTSGVASDLTDKDVDDASHVGPMSINYRWLRLHLSGTEPTVRAP